MSFSGELAFEISVVAHHGADVWDAVMACGVTPYGTEAMHVLRAEKGYVIVGQETDGTQTPQDLGLEWLVSDAKPDFIGRRSHARAGALDPDRKRLVGLLPVDPGERLPEGAQLVVDPDVPPPVPMVGHVTSSYRSAALGRTFALGLVARRHGARRRGAARAAGGPDGRGHGRRAGALRPGGDAPRWPRVARCSDVALPAGLRELPFRAQVNLPRRARPGCPGRATAVRDGERTTLWLGPDEWLVPARPARRPRSSATCATPSLRRVAGAP